MKIGSHRLVFHRVADVMWNECHIEVNEGYVKWGRCVTIV